MHDERVPHSMRHTPADGLAGAHYTSVVHSDKQIRIALEAAQLTRGYAEDCTASAIRLGMSGVYLTASQKVMEEADLVVLALTECQERLTKLAEALIAQGA